jgi:hypothetical protein
MKTFSVLSVTVALTLLGAVPGAHAASFKSCGTVNSVPGGPAKYSVKGVTCKKARKILKRANFTLCFDNTIPNWEKVFTDVPGGRMLTLKNGAKAIKTNGCVDR